MFNIDIALLQALVFLLLLIAVDVLLGIAIALRDKKFNLAEVPRFLQTEVLPYYLGVLAVSGLAMVEDVQQFGTVPLAWAVIVAYGSKVVFVEIRKKVFNLFGVAEGTEGKLPRPPLEENSYRVAGKTKSRIK